MTDYIERKTGRYQTMFQLIVSCTYNFIVNDQNIGPLSLISLSPSLPLSLSHSTPIFLSPSPTLLTSLSLPISLSLYLPLSSSPSLLLSLSFSASLLVLLYLSPLSLPGTRTSTASRHRACYYHVSCHYQLPG